MRKIKLSYKISSALEQENEFTSAHREIGEAKSKLQFRNVINEVVTIYQEKLWRTIDKDITTNSKRKIIITVHRIDFIKDLVCLRKIKKINNDEFEFSGSTETAYNNLGGSAPIEELTNYSVLRELLKSFKLTSAQIKLEFTANDMIHE